MADPQRGELWWINFDPTIGAEISKLRLAVVVSPDAVGKLPLRIVVPVTEWKDRYASYPWHVSIRQGTHNNLTKKSTADCFQVKSVSLERFHNPAGRISAQELEEITVALQICVGAI
jgi:mRNA interferase MazF